MRRIKIKKAQEHIEMIISFIIFLGFVITILVFFNPVKQRTANSGLLDLTTSVVVQNLTEQYQSASLILEKPGVKKCFRIPNNIGAGYNGQYLLVKNITGGVLKSKVTQIYIFIKPLGDTPQDYFIIYFNSSFNANEIPKLELLNSPCADKELDEGKYNWGILDNNSIVFYENILIFNKSYAENYNNLKSGLKLNNDFAFSLLYANQTKIFGQSVLTKDRRNLYTKSFPLFMADKNMTQTAVILNIQAWD